MNIKNNWLGAYHPNQNKVAVDNQPKINKTEQSNFKSIMATKELKAEQTNVPVRVDKIELSSNVPASSSTFDLTKLKEKLMADISKDTEALKVEAIKNQINQNNYKVDATELAHIILQG